MKFFENKSDIIEKGEIEMESNHVKEMQFDAEMMLIKGIVQANIKDRTYSVEITLNKAGEICKASCSYHRGIKCHHIAALALFGYRNILETKKECIWNAPKSSNVAIKTADDLFPAKPYHAVDRQISEEEINELREKLSKPGNTVGFTWLLQKETTE